MKHLGPSKYKAFANYRASDGVTRPMTRQADTEGRARRALEDALREWAKDAAPPTAGMSMGRLLDLWVQDVQASDLAPNTKQLYEHMARRQLRPRMEALRVREVSTGYIDQVLREIAAEKPAAARTARKVISGTLGYAVRLGLIPVNPVRETRPITAKPKKRPTALSRAEAEDLIDKLRADPEAMRQDLPDLVDFMLGTGVRIGEALAVREDTLDLEARRVHIDATVVRIKGQGLVVQPHPKSAAGDRVLPLPEFVCDLVARRRTELRLAAPERVLFPSPFAKSLRDPSNTQRVLRKALDRAGYDITSHVFRKTAVTWLRKAGIDDETLSSFAGHADLGLIDRVYTGRERSVSSEAARVLERKGLDR